MIYIYKVNNTDFLITKKRKKYKLIYKCKGETEYKNSKAQRKKKRERNRKYTDKQKKKEYNKRYYEKRKQLKQLKKCYIING